MEKRIDLSVISLILANLVPIFGVWLFNWNVPSILVFYWLESIIIGFFLILKMIISSFFTFRDLIRDIDRKNIVWQVLVLLFLIFLVLFLLYFQFAVIWGISAFFLGINDIIASINFMNVFLSSLSLFISHSISFFINFIGKREYEWLDQKYFFIIPYERIFRMYIIVLIGALIVSLTKMPVFTIILFIIAKIIVDLNAHNKEHKSLKEFNS